MTTVGCIFSELITLTPLFPSDSEIDHLFKVFRLLGTPEENEGVALLPNFRNTYPKWKGSSLGSKYKNAPLDNLGLDLLSRMLVIDPSLRISASQALKHPYFDELKQ